ncbi:HYR domain-containing protein [Pyxidicoccus parkwayensis]|uniref:HYR domain-containing protein n=1 Tax=Pyxidicoccus parkwayensis TaxID=2813578 RepID=A0ABX7P5W0_9BACT|nr:ELWxxDGT repeat protein [Pyxidicoccus parkwaysis]QSQ25865.1 HYR domain-containing protein [Pyxidicoccus parkwaysis]
MNWPRSLWLALSLIPAMSFAEDGAGALADSRTCPGPDAPAAALLRNVNTQPDISELTLMAESNGTFFFIAVSEPYGYEPWISDGTPGSAHLLKDINPGPESAFSLEDSDYSSAVVDGDFYFPVNDGVHGVELWTSNGTEAGTHLVKDIRPGPGSSRPSFLFDMGHGALLFRADDGVLGWEPWTSHGTAEDTRLLKDILPGPEGSGGPAFSARIGGRTWFLANDGIHGGEPWVTDGTPAGTRMVRDINPGAADSFAIKFTAVGGRVVFQADDGEHGNELWVSDGTEAGTRLLKDIFPGALGGFPDEFQAAGGRVFFFAADDIHGRELWVTDGTEAGTRLVRDIFPGPEHGGFGSIAALGSTVFFAATDEEHGTELWRSDGTERGTVLVRDMNPGPDSGFRFLPGILATGDRLLFGADDGVHGLELWRSDGTERGTVLLQDLIPGPDGSAPRAFLQSGDHIVFIAWDATYNEEPWTLDRSVLSDLRAPCITCPDTVVADAADAYGASVAFPPARAEDNVTRCPAIRYSQASGSRFPVGTTRVTATATDTAANSASCTFKVKVRARR